MGVGRAKKIWINVAALYNKNNIALPNVLQLSFYADYILVLGPYSAKQTSRFQCFIQMLIHDMGTY